jgi:hypothetical protein
LAELGSDSTSIRRTPGAAAIRRRFDGRPGRQRFDVDSTAPAAGVGRHGSAALGGCGRCGPLGSQRASRSWARGSGLAVRGSACGVDPPRRRPDRQVVHRVAPSAVPCTISGPAATPVGSRRAPKLLPSKSCTASRHARSRARILSPGRPRGRPRIRRAAPGSSTVRDRSRTSLPEVARRTRSGALSAEEGRRGRGPARKRDHAGEAPRGRGTTPKRAGV